MKLTFKSFLEGRNIEEAAFKAMDAEATSGLLNDFNEAKDAELKEMIEGKASAEEIEAFKSELAEIQKKQFDQLNAVLKAQGLMIKKLSQGEKEENAVSFKDGLRAGLESNLEMLKKSKEGSKSEAKNAQFNFEVKAAADMLLSTNVSGGNIPVEDRIEGLDDLPSRKVRLLDIMAKRSTQSNVVSWVSKANKDGAAGQTAEGSAKNQIDFDLVVDSESPKKTTAYIKVSTEMLDDISWIESEINNELMKEVQKAVEAQAYSGDGTGQNHNGIRTVASAFAAGPSALGVPNANIVDVLNVAITQIQVAQEGDAEANFILMNPFDVLKLKQEKVSSTDKRYVEELVTVGNNLVLGGVVIIPTTLVTQDEYLVGDFGLSILVTRSGMTFDIGLDGNDFTENMRTILAEWRGLTIVKTNKRTAFVKGDFTTDIAAILQP
jgi:HK97 family phage major capsid protein